MMGTSHATSGALGWLLAVPAAASAAGYEVTAPVLLAGTIATAGAALLPDMDHPKSTIAYTLGPVTYAIAKATHLIFGGHRQGTHTILFALGAGGVTAGLAQWSATAAMVIFWCMTALALKSLHLTPPRMSNGKKGIFIAVEATAIVWLMTQHMPASDWGVWLGVAVGLGCLLHLTGDCCTPEGCPLFAPLSRRRFAVPFIDHTGNFLETKIITPLMTVAVLFLLWKNFWPDLQQALPDGLPLVT